MGARGVIVTLFAYLFTQFAFARTCENILASTKEYEVIRIKEPITIYPGRKPTRAWFHGTLTKVGTKAILTNFYIVHQGKRFRLSAHKAYDTAASIADFLKLSKPVSWNTSKVSRFWMRIIYAFYDNTIIYSLSNDELRPLKPYDHDLLVRYFGSGAEFYTMLEFDLSIPWVRSKFYWN